MAKIDSLEVEITAKSSEAATSIRNLMNSVKALQTTISKTYKVSNNFTKNLEEIGKSVGSIDAGSISKINSLAHALKNMKDLGKLSVSKDLAQRISDLGVAAKDIEASDGTNLKNFASALSQLSKVKNLPKELSQRMTEIGTAAQNLPKEAIENLKEFSEAIAKMSGADFKGVNSVIGKASKIKNVAKAAKETSTAAKELEDGTTRAKTSLTPEDDVGGTVDAAKKAKEIADSGAFSDIGSVSKIANAALKEFKKTIGEVTSTLKSAGQASLAFTGKLAQMTSGAYLKGIKTFADSMSKIGTSFGKAVFNATPVGQFASALGKAAKQAKQLYSGLARIALYRILRTVFKDVSSSMETALQALYKYDAALGGSFAKTMDGLTSAATQATASLGTLAANVISLLAPAINTAIALVTKLLDAISALLAAIGGNVFYKSTASSKKFADTMKAGGSAAKEWKNQLLGFDEINRLEDSSGGGGGGSDPFKGIEFEPIKELPDWLKDVSDLINSDRWQEAGYKLADHMAAILNGWDAETWGGNLGKKIQHGIEFALGVFQNKKLFMEAGFKLADTMNGIFKSIDGKKLGEMFAEKWNAIFTFLDSLAIRIDSDKVGKELGQAMSEMFSKINVNLVIATVRRVTNTIITALKVFILNWDLSDAVAKVSTAFGGSLAAFGEEIDSSNIATTIVSWVADVDWEGAITSITEGMASLTDSLSNEVNEVVRAGGKLDEIAEKIGNGLKTAPWGRILTNVAHIITSTMFAALKIAVGASDSLPTIGTAVGEALSGVLEDIQEADFNTGASTLVNNVFGAVESFISSFPLATAISTLTGKFKDLLSIVAARLTSADEEGKTIADKLYAWVKDVDWYNATKDISDGVVILLNSIVTEVKKLGDEEHRAQIYNAIRDAFTGVDWAGLFEAVAELAWTWFKFKWEMKFEAIGGIIDSVRYKVVGASTEVEQAGYDMFMSMENTLADTSIIWNILRDTVQAGEITWNDAASLISSINSGIIDENGLVLQDVQWTYEDIISKALHGEESWQWAIEKIVGASNTAETAVSDLSGATEEAMGNMGETAQESIAQLSNVATAASEMLAQKDAVMASNDALSKAVEASAIAGLNEASANFQTTLDSIMTSLTNFTTEVSIAIGNSLTEPMSTELSTVQTETDTVLDNILASVTSTMDDIVAKVKASLQSIATMAGTTRLDIHGSVPIFDATLYDLGNGMTFPQISMRLQYFARGGIVDGASLFGNNVIGEDGKEAIIPLERNTEWISRVADQINAETDDASNDDVVNAIFAIGNMIVEAVNNKDVATFPSADELARIVTKKQTQNARAMGV